MLAALIVLNVPHYRDILRDIRLVPQNELILASRDLFGFSWILVVIEAIGDEQARAFYLLNIIVGFFRDILRANLIIVVVIFLLPRRKLRVILPDFNLRLAIDVPHLSSSLALCFWIFFMIHRTTAASHGLQLLV